MANKGRGIHVEKTGKDVYKAANIKEFTLDDPKGNEVLVKFLAVPVNPSDVYCITGSYSDGPKAPFYVGFEGVGEIVKIGPNVKSVKIGDWVVPSVPKFGSWRTLSLVPENHVMKLDKSLGLVGAATFFVNPFTAYCLLKDIVELKKGDTVLQNGGNSQVGLAIIQFAKEMGIKTINVIRKREAKAENALKKKMQDLGADLVITDEDLKKHGTDESWPSGLSKPKLVIDCVSGQSGSELVRHLINGGTFCNYGIMSGEPLTVNPVEFLFNSKTCTGFWLTPQMAKKPERAAKEIAPYITDLVKRGKFKGPECEMYKLDDFREALKRSTAGYSNVKPLLVLDESLMK